MDGSILGAVTLPGSPADQSRPIVLVSEWFPPAVGGSAELLANIYSRIPEVTVLTAPAPPPDPSEATGPLRVCRRLFGVGLGVVNAASAFGHVRLARDLRALDRGARAVIHCGRALPEGTMAWMAGAGRRPYFCWTHGEELPIAATSRELTWLMRRVHRGAAGLFANSHNTARLLGELGNPPEQVHVVYPGVDAVRFSPVPRHNRVRLG